MSEEPKEKAPNPIRLRLVPDGTGKPVGRHGRTFETSNRVNISKAYSDRRLNKETGEFEPTGQGPHGNMSQKAADVVAEAVLSFVPTAEKPFRNIGLSTGGGSRGMYDKLVEMSRKGLDFSHINFFNLDEYVNLPPDDPRSYNSEMHKNFFDRIPEGRRPHSINIPDGMLAAQDENRACREYEEKIDKAGGIYLQVLGIGENAHLAFVEPNMDRHMNDPTSIYGLTESTRKANMRFFDDDLSQVPHKAISMGLGRIKKAEKIILLANGADEGQGLKKIEALTHAGYGPVTPEFPASILQEHNDTTYFLTEESAQALGLNFKTFWQDQAKAGIGSAPTLP